MTPEQQQAIAAARSRLGSAQPPAPLTPDQQQSVAAAQSRLDAPPQPPQDLSWGEVGGQALMNTPASAGQFVSDMTAIIREPVTTSKAIGNLVLGTMQKGVSSGVIPQINDAPDLKALYSNLGIDAPGASPVMQAGNKEVYAETVGNFLAERYGGIENLKRTMASDPVGFLADVSMILTGGASAAARAPGKVGQIASKVGKAAQLLDPVNATVAAAKKVGQGANIAVPTVLGIMTGAGDAPIREAYQAGKSGGRPSAAFTRNMRGGADEASQILEEAKSGVEQLRRQRADAYRSGMVDISADKTVLDFSKIDDAFNQAFDANTFKGVPKSEGAAKALQAVKDEIDKWRAYSPDEFHTPEGLDALKQRIGDLMDWKNGGDKENRAIQSMYNDVRNIISDQAPTYSKTMEAYSEASAQLDDLTKALSLGNKASADTALRKLTSVMRNNVNTNYGSRTAQVQALQDATGRPILPAIAGQAMNAWAPRGLASLGTHAAGTAALATFNPWALATLPFQSPRLVGEGAKISGQVAGNVGRQAQRLGPIASKLAPAVGYGPRMGSVQVGRLARELEGM